MFINQIYDLAKETVVLLLDFNPDTQGLLDWVIDRCYTGANEVADGCFELLYTGMHDLLSHINRLLIR
jgi:hypothetical protein